MPYVASGGSGATTGMVDCCGDVPVEPVPELACMLLELCTMKGIPNGCKQGKKIDVWGA